MRLLHLFNRGDFQALASVRQRAECGDYMRCTINLCFQLKVCASNLWARADASMGGALRTFTRTHNLRRILIHLKTLNGFLAQLSGNSSLHLRGKM